jgi:hypothetical protein
VFGYNWLTHYNPLIDWVLSSITFPTTSKENPIPDSTPSMRATVSEEIEPQIFLNFSDSASVDGEIPPSPQSALNPTPKVDISLVNAVAYLRACSMPGSQEFSINLVDNKITTRGSSSSDSPPVDLSNVPEEYHKFADVFDKAKTDTLAGHQPYDLKINIKEGHAPPLRQVYSLSQTELQALREFLDEHLAAGCI